MSAVDLPEETQQLERCAREVMECVAQAGLRVTTAESCTGGLLASLITDLEGVSSAFDRGFVTYEETAKIELLGVSGALIADRGVVSDDVAHAMAYGALNRSKADLAIAITGFAGEAGGRDEAGLVNIAALSRSGQAIVRECHFGAAGRDLVRMRSVRAALEMLRELATRIAQP